MRREAVYEHAQPNSECKEGSEVGADLACCVTAWRSPVEQRPWVEDVRSCEINGGSVVGMGRTHGFVCDLSVLAFAVAPN